MAGVISMAQAIDAAVSASLLDADGRTPPTFHEERSSADTSLKPVWVSFWNLTSNGIGTLRSPCVR